MAITGAPSILVGGATSSGPSNGDYHVIVSDAQNKEAKSGRPQLVLELTVKDDPGHAAKEGKKLTSFYQSLPMEGDDDDKVKTMNGMLRRRVYDACGIKWPEQPKLLDARQFVGKQFWVRIGKRDGQDRAEVIATAKEQAQLPVAKEQIAAGNPKGAAKGAAARR